MHHVDMRLRASEYLDGELPPGQRMEFERHLGSCDSCRRFVQELQTVVELLGEIRRATQHSE